MPTNYSSKFKNLIRDTSGNIALSTALVMIPLGLAGGAALDFSRLANSKTSVQNAVDGAALVGAKTALTGKRKDVRKVARAYLKANLTPAEFKEVKGIQIKFDNKTGAVTVTAQAEKVTSLLRLANVKALEYSPTAIVTIPQGNLEVVLVLDSTGSMSFDGKMDSLKVAATEFIEDMLELNQDIDRVKIGVVPFSQYVNVGLENRNARWIDVPEDRSETKTVPVYEWTAGTSNCGERTYYVDGVAQTREGCDGGTSTDTGRTREQTTDYKWSGCVGSRKQPLNLEDRQYNRKVPGLQNVSCPSPIAPLSANEEDLKDKINALVPTSSTYIPAGLTWGLRAISSKAPFDEGLTKNKAKKTKTRKIIVLMSDGENQSSAQLPDSPLHNGKDLTQANKWTEMACNNIKKEEITLYTIGFGTNIPPATQKLLQECSTDSENYLAAIDGKALSARFGQISQQLTQLYLSN